MKIVTILLAAGRSSRMGSPKALLMWRGQTFLERALRAFSAAPAEENLVVTGFDRERIEAEVARVRPTLPLFKSTGVRCVHNAAADSGLMSSLQTGLRAITTEVDGALIGLVDQPHLEPLSIAQFVAAVDACSPRPSLARADFAGRPGHPCWIGREHFSEILSRPLVDEGANFLFRRAADEVVHVSIPHAGVDIDTPQDYEGLLHAP